MLRKLIQCNQDNSKSDWLDDVDTKDNLNRETAVDKTVMLNLMGKSQ
jgi:hypothetical protein